MRIFSRLAIRLGRALLLSAPLLAHLPSAAQSTLHDTASVKKERNEVLRKLDALNKAIHQTSDEKKQATKTLTLLEAALEQTQARLHTLNTDRNALETDIHSLSRQEAQLQKDLANTQNRLAQVMRNQYQRVEVNPTQAWLAGKSASQAAREGYWYERISTAERNLSIDQTTQAQELETIRLNLEKKRAQLQETIVEQSKSQRELATQREERNQLIAELNSKLKNQELEQKRLKRDESRLSSVITELTRAIEEARRKQALAAQQQQQRQAQAKGSKTPQQKPEYTPPPMAMPSSGEFAALKGRLVLPTPGTVVGQFGQTRSKDGQGPSWKGIFIATSAGQAVRTVGAGRVVFSEWLRGFGEIVIINHGDQFLSVYGNNGKLLKRSGDSVKAGDVIAETGNSSGNLDIGLYFELRHQGQPFDPISWTRDR